MPYTPTDFSVGSTFDDVEADKLGAGIQAAHVLVDRFDQVAMAAAGEPQVLAFHQSSGLWGPRSLTSVDVPGIVWDTVTGTSYTMVSADAGRGKHFTSNSAITVTWPTGLVTAAGAVFYFRTYGTGQVSNVTTGGAVVNARGGTLKSADRYANWQADRVFSTNEYILSGDLVV